MWRAENYSSQEGVFTQALIAIIFCFSVLVIKEMSQAQRSRHFTIASEFLKDAE